MAGIRLSVRALRQTLVLIISAVLLTVLVVAVVLSASPPQGSEREASEPGYPPAPEQQQPVAAEGAAAGRTPLTELVDSTWTQTAAERTGIPVRAVAAYGGAAAHLAQTEPECGIGWNTLAGIGAVESHHGRFDGSGIAPDGTVEPPIVGPALDGSPGVLEIPDTDDGELDGDAQYDRAVGPMQFIPTTWRRYAHDGNLNGRTDPHHYDDAALTAAVYLCRRGGDLTGDEGWVNAVVAYNQSVRYVHDVAAAAERYAAEADPE